MNERAETTGSADDVGADDPIGTVSVLALFNRVLRQRRFVLVVALLFLGIGLLVVLFSGRDYAVESSFTPEVADDGASGPGDMLQRLAPGLGLREGGKLNFYTEVLRSRELLKRAVTTEYDVDLPDDPESAPRRADLVTVYGIERGDERDRIQAAIDELAENLSTSTDAGAGLVRLRVHAQSPGLAMQINRRLLTLLNEFNVERRQGSAAAERAFVEERVQAARADLHAAEERLERFYAENRRFSGSPELSFTAARLEREIGVLQEVYVALARSLEQVKIQEVRATPLITIVDPPEWALPESAPPGWLQLLLWLVLGAGLGIILALVRDILSRQRELNPADYEEFNEHLAALHGILPRFARKRSSARTQRSGRQNEQAPVSSGIPAEDSVEVGR